MTYPDPRVAALLHERFGVIRVDVKNVLPAQRDLIRVARPLWTPTVVFVAGSDVVRRAVGYLPPDDFLAEAHIALGQIDLLHQEFDRAFATFRTAADSFRAPEALYWAGVAAFKRARTLDAVRPLWDELQARHPGSEWARRADVWSVLDK